MSNPDNLENPSMDKFSKKINEISANKKLKNKSRRNNSSLSTFGAIINIIWFLTLFVNPPINPFYFIAIGGFALIVTLLIKLYFRLKATTELVDIQGGGSIVGYVIVWVLVQFYANKSASVQILNYSYTVNEILSYYLIIIFLIWFFIPTKPALSQEIIFGLHPLISYFILNFWKLLIILLFIVQIWNLNYLSPTITAILLLICILELIGMYHRIFKLEITDIILDLGQLLVEIIKGPVVSIKWVLLIITLLILGQIQSSLIVIAVLGFTLIMGFISITTFISKLTIDSGMIQRKSNEVVSSVPQIFSDLKELQVDDFYSNYFQVITNFDLKRKTKILRFSSGDLLFKIPLKHTLESMTGIYCAKLSLSNQNRKRSRRQRENKPSIANHINIKSVSQFRDSEWNQLLQQDKIENVSSDIVMERLGVSDKEEFDKLLEKSLKDFSKIQENIRDRIRGVPATWEQGKVLNIESLPNGIPLSDEILNDLKKQGITNIELIPGKDEFLFYVKKKN